MSDKLQVAIVGLGLVGASAGLALHKFQERVAVIGHDRSPELASVAKKLGAVDSTEWSMINAVMNADRVILALPLEEIRDTLDAIKENLRPGCVIVDTADVKGPVVKWAAELLPAGVHFVGGHPIILSDRLDVEGARPDLFEGKLFCLTPDSRTDDSAVRLAADVVEALGGKPFFLDAQEHDGLAAAVEHLPSLLATALMSITSRSAGWRDMRKLAGNQYYASTLVLADSGKEAIASPMANREHVVPWLDAMIAELSAYREQLLAGETTGLATDIDRGLEAGHSWLAASLAGNWDADGSRPDAPTAGTTFRDLFFGSLGRPRAQTTQAEQKKRK
jgi:prephenate dehydrogenase